MIDVRDLDSVRAMGPFLVAHRGGVVGPDAPENSVPALCAAAAHGYAMVEVDVMETRDHYPVLLHDGLYINCGVEKAISDLTRDEVTSIRYRASEEHVITFDRAVELCASFGMGMMLDKLRTEAGGDASMSEECLHRVASLIRDAGLERSCVAIVDSPRLRAILGEVSLFPMGKSVGHAVMAGTATPPKNDFWFGWGAEVSNEGLARLQAAGAFGIVSINTFHYPQHASEALAAQDVDRLLAVGIEGFQIDSVYEPLFRKG